MNCFLYSPFHLYIIGASLGKAGLAPLLLQTQLTPFTNISQEKLAKKSGRLFGLKVWGLWSLEKKFQSLIVPVTSAESQNLPKAERL